MVHQPIYFFQSLLAFTALLSSHNPVFFYRYNPVLSFYNGMFVINVIISVLLEQSLISM